MTKDLKKHFFHGVVWAGTRRFLEQGMQTVTTLILARILSPHEFGVIGIANIFILFANTINNLGISSALIQRKEIDEGHLSSAFWANVVTGVTLCLMMMFLSWPAARFFRNDEVQPVLFVLSFNFILAALRIVQNAQFSRNLQFGKLASLSVWEMASNSILTIALAVKGLGVWSLVWGRLFGIGMGTLLAWASSPWRPQFMFQMEKFRQLFKFGINAMSVNILTYLGQNIDYVIVGRFLGTVPLGFYTMAYNLVTLPQRKISSILTSVAFPTFAKIQDDNARVARNYLKILSYISIVTFPLLFGLLMVSPYFVKVIIGEKWLPIVKPMQIMCVLGMINSISMTMGSIFYAKGRPDIEFKADILNLAALAAAIMIGVKFGITGVAVAVTIVAMVGAPLIFLVISRLIGTNMRTVYQALHPALVCSLSMGAVLFTCDRFLTAGAVPEALRLVILIGIGVLSYFFFHRLYRFPMIAEVAEIFKQNLSRKRAEA
ncbi:MAG: MOP flippase family protein [Candidatus Omnitrophica bacterium]|nr:MOP flippase family protein [Candidatus Omnitrophota bacterium]